MSRRHCNNDDIGYNKFKRTYRDAMRGNFIDAKNPRNLGIGYNPQPITIVKEKTTGYYYIKILPTRRHKESNEVYLRSFPGYRLISDDDDNYDTNF